MAEAIQNAVTVAKKYNIRKLVVMSMWGATDSYDSLGVLMKSVMKWSNMAQTLEDHDMVDKIVRQSGVNFVLARPTVLKGEEVTELKELGDHGEKAPFMPSISPNTVAGFLVDVIEKDTWDGRTPVLSA